MKGEPTDRGLYADMADFDRRSKEADAERRIIRRTAELFEKTMIETNHDAVATALLLANKLALMEEER